jgi:hypothetical protein
MTFAMAPTPADATWPDGTVELDWTLDTREPMHPTILNFKPTHHEIMRGVGHQDRVGRAYCLNARGNIWRITKDVDFTAAAFADDHRAAVDSDANE